MATQIVTETTGTLAASTGGKKVAGIISPGQGSSGFYAQDVIEAAGADKIFPAGTHMYFDHPAESEKFERPERSVLHIGAVTTEDAHWDDALEMLVAEYEPIAAYKALLEDKTFLGAIGLSIRAAAEVEETSQGRVVKRIVEGKSIDFVTHAGRGGRPLLELMESARPSVINARALTHSGIEEATVNDKREALSSVVRDAYAADRTYVWLRDFDDTNAWFDIESGDDSGTYQQAYTAGEDDMPNALIGERIEVRASTTYVPVVPAGQSITNESQGDTMGNIEVDEAEYRNVTSRVTTLESERDTAIKERDEAKAEVEESRTAVRESKISTIIAEADAEFDDLQVAGLKASAPIKEGALDEAAFKTTVDEAAARIAEANGAGRPRGNGPRINTTDTEVSEADLDAVDSAIFGETKEA